MIVVKIFGGLGNQMFQYAFGRRLALERNTELFFDFGFFDGNAQGDFTKRDFQLDLFNIKGNLVSKEVLDGFSQSKFAKAKSHFLINSPLAKQANYLREPHFHFYQKALSCGDTVYVSGYWQSEKYFQSIRKQLVEDFVSKNELSEQSKIVLNEINKLDAISLHIRRGDYTNAQNTSVYHTCSPDYYANAINTLIKKVNNPRFFVFSDDFDWVKKNIKIDYPVTYVEHNVGKDSYQDMILMSKCKHNIIANSSFSWWGAWLNTNNDKIVVAPVNWFKSPDKNTKDLICDSWLKM